MLAFWASCIIDFLCTLSHFQTEANCKPFLLKMRGFLHENININFISTAFHLALLWNRSLRQLGNRQLAGSQLLTTFLMHLLGEQIIGLSLS